MSATEIRVAARKTNRSIRMQRCAAPSMDCGMTFVQAAKQSGTVRLEVSGSNLAAAQVESQTVASKVRPAVA